MTNDPPMLKLMVHHYISWLYQGALKVDARLTLGLDAIPREVEG